MKVLVTGGAGFIGSNLVEALLSDERVTKVRVLDNLATGSLNNIKDFVSSKNFEFIEGDIRNIETCLASTTDIDLISHQAALGSVPRSINDPLTTNNVNVAGTLNIFHAAIQNNVKRVVFAASSSTYGDSKSLPKVENKIGNPLSPYAVTKYVNEVYADVFSKTYDFEYIGLRYFNVFGPKQSPEGAYAAVIPLFFKAALENTSPTINGDGSFSRDFTFVQNVVHANLQSLFFESTQNEPSPQNQIYNVAFGERVSIDQLWTAIKEISGSEAEAIYGSVRDGDVPHSLASIEKARSLLNYRPKVDLIKGLNISYKWFLENY